MHSYPSRSEKRQFDLYAAANGGDLSVKNMLLYPSEIKKLKKEGFSTLKADPSLVSKGLESITVDWSNAYSNDVPPIVINYINGIIDTFPKNSVNTFAQELYVIAHRVNNLK